MKEQLKMHEIFEVYINNHLYPVWSIEGKCHGGWNGGPKEWWLWYSKEPPNIKDLEDDRWVSYEDKIIPRIVWEIDYKQRTSSKVKWGDHMFSQSGYCNMIANGKIVYAFHSRTLEYALAKVVTLQVRLLEHPFDFLNPEKEDGRKIWYKGQPATIETLKSEPWEIRIKPDTEDLESWWNSVISLSTIGCDDQEKCRLTEYWQEWKDYGEINHGPVLADGNINWFRK